MNTPNRDAYRLKTKKHMSVFNVTKSIENQTPPARPDAPLAAGPSPGFPILSKKVTWDGSNLYAAENITVGQVLIKETPAFTVLHADDKSARGRLCPYTLENMPAPVPCSLGSQTLYRDEAVRQEAEESYRKVEYGVVDAAMCQGLTPTALMALRMTSMVPWLMKKMGANDLNQPEHEPVGHYAERLRQIARVHALANVLDNGPPACRQMAVVSAGAAFLFVLLRKMSGIASEEDLFKDVTPEETKSAKSLYQSVLASVTFARPIRRSLPPTASKGGLSALFDSSSVYPTAGVGFGMFPYLELLLGMEEKEGPVHLVAFEKCHSLVAVAIKPIQKGEKISLRLDPITKKQTDETSKKVKLRCAGFPDCKADFPLQCNTKDRTITCPMEGCGKKTHVFRQLSGLHVLNIKYETAKKMLLKGDVTSLSEGINLMNQLLVEFNSLITGEFIDVAVIHRDLSLAIQYLHFLEDAQYLAENC